MEKQTDKSCVDCHFLKCTVAKGIAWCKMEKLPESFYIYIFENGVKVISDDWKQANECELFFIDR